MTFLYEVCRLIPENIKTKSLLLKTNYNKMRVSLGSLWYGNEFVFKPRLFNALRQSRSGH